MGLWGRLARLVSGRDPAVRQEAERILLEADFGVAATAAILDALDRGGAHDEAALERIVAELLGPAGSLGTGEGIDDLEPFDPGAHARRLVRD